MFGYVIADFTSLSRSAKERYKQYYCGLCNALSRNYGKAARFLLNYDTAFLSLMLNSCQNDCDLAVCRCPYRFGKKTGCKTGAVADYCADVTVLLSCLKFEDDIKDDNSCRAKLLSKLFKNSFLKAKSRQPDLCESISRNLALLSDSERQNEQNPLVPAEIFGQLLGGVFGHKLYHFGFALGKFIYLCDAACDFDKDLKRGRYNPLIRCRKSEIEGLLLSVMDECTAEYGQLAVSRNNDIIENILYSGLWLKYNLKRKRR